MFRCSKCQTEEELVDEDRKLRLELSDEDRKRRLELEDGILRRSDQGEFELVTHLLGHPQLLPEGFKDHPLLVKREWFSTLSAKGKDRSDLGKGDLVFAKYGTGPHVSYLVVEVKHWDKKHPAKNSHFTIKRAKVKDQAKQYAMLFKEPLKCQACKVHKGVFTPDELEVVLLEDDAEEQMKVESAASPSDWQAGSHLTSAGTKPKDLKQGEGGLPGWVQAGLAVGSAVAAFGVCYELARQRQSREEEERREEKERREEEERRAWWATAGATAVIIFLIYLSM
mmetsp:Transcript_6894/g.11747  ORF Transcript_6894/g.11747 Transcript_6894/m.11747 type:complete len:282 (-) Transcript_6894:417-1262(-)